MTSLVCSFEASRLGALRPTVLHRLRGLILTVRRNGPVCDDMSFARLKVVRSLRVAKLDSQFLTELPVPVTI